MDTLSPRHAVVRRPGAPVEGLRAPVDEVVHVHTGEAADAGLVADVKRALGPCACRRVRRDVENGVTVPRSEGPLALANET